MSYLNFYACPSCDHKWDAYRPGACAVDVCDRCGRTTSPDDTEGQYLGHAESALKAFIWARANRGLGAAAMLDPSQNPDLREDFVDCIADLLALAHGLGLDFHGIARMALHHADAETI